MEKPDARYLKLEVQEYLRQQAIRLRQQGKTFISISEYLGVHRNTVASWWKEYERRGEDALQQYARGRQLGKGRTFERDQKK
ncbi:MAG: helix-turn-helix domain-containing protein, partial [Hydrococcus sp. RM1_1_31]|nr:helix-turn-helix domain-containing protein [Hydrococcus sp. RM1_1_31]